VPVDIYLFPILAVPGYVGDVMVAIELLDASIDGLQYIQHDATIDIIAFD
jgi:hypothetical protein